MEQKRQPYLSVGIDIGADFSIMAAALPMPLYHRLKDAGLEVFILNPIVTHANQNINIHKRQA